MTQSTDDTVQKILNQAKDSLRKVEGVVENFVKIPNAEERKRITAEKIALGLRTMGVATQEDLDALRNQVNALEKKVASLEARLRDQTTV